MTTRKILLLFLFLFLFWGGAVNIREMKLEHTEDGLRIALKSGRPFLW